MYIAVSTVGKKACGDVFVVKKDRLFDEVGVYEVGGKLIGYVPEDSPDGCLKRSFILENIGDTRVIATGAVAFGNMLILSTDSPTLAVGRYAYRETSDGASILVSCNG